MLWRVSVDSKYMERLRGNWWSQHNFAAPHRAQWDCWSVTQTDLHLSLAQVNTIALGLKKQL